MSSPLDTFGPPGEIGLVNTEKSSDGKGRRNRKVIGLVTLGLGILMYVLTGGRWPLPQPVPEPSPTPITNSLPSP